MKALWLRILLPLLALAMVSGYEALPARVGGPGPALSRQDFLLLMLGSSATLLLCTPTFVRGLARRGPQHLNLPHKAYWLAPERAEASLERLGEHLAELGLGLVALLAGVYVQALQQGQAARWMPPEGFAVAAGGLAVWGALWLWRLLRLFPAPPQIAAPRRAHHP